MYIVSEEEHLIIIDPCETEYDLSDKHVDYIMLTHEHYDHISGVNYWKNRTGANVICSSICADNIQSAKKNMSHYFQAFCQMQTWAPWSDDIIVEDYSCTADIIYDREYDIQWIGHSIHCNLLPGHSEGGTCIIIDNSYMFSGDSIIWGYEPTLRFPGGSRKQWVHDSLPKLRSLDENITVYPGHFETFKLKDYNW